MKHKIALTAALCIFTCTATWAAEPASVPVNIKNKGFITAGIMPNYPPMDFKDPATNQLTGVDYDLGMEIGKRLGVEIKWQETAFEQMVSSLVTQRLDIVLSGMTDTAERQKTIDFVDYFKTGPQFYVLDSTKDVKEATDLCGKRVGTSRRTTFPAEIAKWSAQHCEASGKPAIIVVGTEGSADARAQLRQARVDSAVQGSETLPYIQSQEPGAYRVIGEPLTVQLTGLGVAKSSSALSAAIVAALDAMIADGTYGKILGKWGLSEGAVDKAQMNAGR